MFLFIDVFIQKLLCFIRSLSPAMCKIFKVNIGFLIWNYVLFLIQGCNPIQPTATSFMFNVLPVKCEYLPVISNLQLIILVTNI